MKTRSSRLSQGEAASSQDAADGPSNINNGDSSRPEASNPAAKSSDDELSMKTPVRSRTRAGARKTNEVQETPEEASQVRTGLRSSTRKRKLQENLGLEGQNEATPSPMQRRQSARKAKSAKHTEDPTTEPPAEAQHSTRRTTRRRSSRKVQESPQIETAGEELPSETAHTSEGANVDLVPKQSNKEQVSEEEQREKATLSHRQGPPRHDEAHFHDTVADDKKKPAYVDKLAATIKKKRAAKQVSKLAQVTLEKLNGKRLVPLKGLDNEYHTVHQLLEQTVVAGEGNSMLLLGPRGTGKSTIVETSIRELSREHQDDFHVVRLNGFLHTDDRIALREIWKQLGRETEAEEDVAKTTSYADTMASLLALLSHPEELFGASEDPDTLTTAKSVIILLDEFDLFAQHPRQTLLYNLFDIAQSRKAPLAVIGITTKVEVTEQLEKRVKSRFSHRYTFVPKPSSVEVLADICKAAISIDDGELEEGDAQQATDLASALLSPIVKDWNDYAEAFVDDPQFRHSLEQIFYQTNSPSEIFTALTVPFNDFYLSLLYPGSEEHLVIPTPEALQFLPCPDPAPLPFHPTACRPRPR
ncbi:hypothetical protein KEM55_004232 [Ascosphaera atra]|nr:hypothetical protein KEM55_004232 [Ascosphaera atra]